MFLFLILIITVLKKNNYPTNVLLLSTTFILTLNSYADFYGGNCVCKRPITITTSNSKFLCHLVFHLECRGNSWCLIWLTCFSNCAAFKYKFWEFRFNYIDNIAVLHNILISQCWICCDNRRNDLAVVCHVTMSTVSFQWPNELLPELHCEFCPSGGITSTIFTVQPLEICREQHLTSLLLWGIRAHSFQIWCHHKYVSILHLFHDDMQAVILIGRLTTDTISFCISAN